MLLILTLCLSVVSSVVGSLEKTGLSSVKECAAVVLTRDMFSFQSKYYHQGFIRVYGASSNVSDGYYAPNTLLMTITLLPHSAPMVVSENRRPHVSVAFDVLRIEYELDSSINDRRKGVYYFRPSCRSTLKNSSFKMGSLGTLHYACGAYEHHPSCAQEGYVSKLNALHEHSALRQILECEHCSNERVPQVVEDNNKAWVEATRYMGLLLLRPLMFMRDIGMGWNHVAAKANEVFDLRNEYKLNDSASLRQGSTKKDEKKEVAEKEDKAPQTKALATEPIVETPKNESNLHHCHECDHHRRLQMNFSDLSVNNVGTEIKSCMAIEVPKDSISFINHYHVNGIARIFAVSNDPSDHHYDVDHLLFTYTALPQSTPRIISREGLLSASLAFNVLRVQYDFDSPTMPDRRQGEFLFTPNCVDSPMRHPIGEIGFMRYQCTALKNHPSCATSDYQEKANEVRFWSLTSQLEQFSYEGTPKVSIHNRRVWFDAFENVIWLLSQPFHVFDYLGGSFNHIADYVGMDSTKALRVDKK